MLKNKTKLLLIILMVITIALSPFSYADDEKAKENTNEQQQVQEDTEEQNDDDQDNEETISDDEVEIDEESPEDSQEDAQENNTDDSEPATEADEDNAISESAMQQQMQNVKSGDEYLVGDSITVDYPVDGNLYVMGNEVTIKSQVVGNAYILANKLTVEEDGYVGASLFALGSEINLKGVTYDLYSTSETLNVIGYVYRDLHSVASTFNLEGVVGRNATIAVQNFTAKESSEPTVGKIMGSLYYSAEKQIAIPDGVVSGEVNFTEVSPISAETGKNYIMEAVTYIACIVIIALLLQWLAPKFNSKTTIFIQNKLIKTVGFGLLGLIAIPVVSVLLMVSRIAAPVGLGLLALYIILLCISDAICIIAINNLVAKKIKFETTLKKLLLLVVISLIAWGITLIPAFGAFINLVLSIVGLGFILRNILSKKDKDETSSEQQ